MRAWCLDIVVDVPEEDEVARTCTVGGRHANLQPCREGADQLGNFTP